MRQATKNEQRPDDAAGSDVDERRVDDVYGNIVVVLNETQDLVNIAGSIRAMMNTGLSRLRLVRPAEFDRYRIEGIAHGSADVLEHAEFFDTLGDAVADAVHVVGTTARRRAAAYIWQHPREAAPELLEIAALGEGPVALVFGREDKGLSNEDLDRCDRVLTVPTDPRRPSLNLAQAVLLVAYELWVAGAARARPLPRPRRRAERHVNAEEFHALSTEVANALATIDFFKGRNPEPIMRSLRAIARRADLDVREAKLLRAIAFEVQKVFKRIR
ncbi:MAG TPA: TrmJ/YjtD family RNA methyltransferase [Longimicrobiales bacterium]